MSDLPDADGSDELDLGALDEIRPGAWLAPGRQMVVNDQLVRGLRFAHHITQAELMADWLDVVPDFAAIAAFAHHYDLPGGGRVEVVEPDPTDLAAHELAGLVLRGPQGWLAGAGADRLVVLSIDGGELTVAFEETSSPVSVDPTPIIATFEGLGGGQPVPLLDLVLHLLIDHPAVFDATPPTPLRDLLLVAGLDVAGTTVHRADLRPAARGADPVGLPGLGISSALAAERLLTALLTGDAQPVDDDVLDAVTDADAVAAMAEQVVGGNLVPPAQLEALVDHLAAAARPDSHAGLAFLRSRLAEWQGDAAAQEEALDAAARSAQQPAALVDAAWFAADRGDARGALALLRAAHVPADDPDLELLLRYTVGGSHLVGRNELCWCGSGRKHKHCCLRLNGHDLGARASWLHAKAVTFLQRPPQRAALLAVATASAGVAVPDDAPARVIAAACDASVAELCLFEGGAFQRFLDQRGALLPDDERELARQWAGGRHHIWEVLDGGQRLRDTSDGTERTLDPASAAKIPPSGYVLAVVQDGPLALPGPAQPVAASVLEELTALLATGEPAPIAAMLGLEFGWTAAPDVGSQADRAPDALAPAP
jgi:uncharacterized protein YecA (UPF0149 family)